MVATRATIICIVGLILFGTGATVMAQPNWSTGDRCLANWSEDEYWYPGTVLEAQGGRYHIQFDDWAREWLAADSLAVEELEIGDAVEARWMAGHLYYQGKIAERIKNVIRVLYDDGDVEWTTIAVVRVLGRQ